ncbi:MAG TPA: DUF6754 domain-containing protein [Kofleriaceae bacterium]|nr:DUF6754 domain-containing protein [Kofleriaceae bacterium]
MSGLRRILPAFALLSLLAAPSAHAQGPAGDGLPAVRMDLPAPADVRVTPPKNDDGHHLTVSWKKFPDMQSLVFRTPYANPGPVPIPPADSKPGQWVGDWMLIAIVGESSFTDDVTATHATSAAPPPVILSSPPAPPTPAPPPPLGLDASRPRADGLSYAVMTAFATDEAISGVSPAVVVGPATARTAPFNTDRWFFLLIIVCMAFALWYFVKRITKNPHDVFIRRIAGVDAIEDAVGRSTEMGRPVLYVTGTEEIQNIQTIASLLVLGHVAEMTAEYDTEIKVANFFPLTMVVAEEIVKQGFANAGRIDAHKPENVMFISAEQFAYAAGINGMILRDKPATNIYLGRFFAESLILAETGYVTKAVQIAGTAEITQLPFFIAACDYTIIGEELYAVSAYLSREPGLLATLKSTDLLKVGILILLVVGVVLSSFGIYDLGSVLVP